MGVTTQEAERKVNERLVFKITKNNYCPICLGWACCWKEKF